MSPRRRRAARALPVLFFLFGCSRSLDERLQAAAAQGNTAKVADLLKKGADASSVDEDGWSPILWAASSGGAATVETLLNAGASVETPTPKEREAPLTLAAKWNQVDVVEALVRRGARIEERDSIGWTALMWASLKGRSDVVEALLRSGARVNASDSDGNTPLMLAARQGRGDAVRSLLAHGASPAARNSAGDTAESLAAAAGHPEISALLKNR